MKSPKLTALDFLFEAGIALMIVALILAIIIVVGNLILDAVGFAPISSSTNQLLLGGAGVCLLMTLVFFLLALLKS